MTPKPTKEEDIVYSQNFEDRLDELEDVVVKLTQRHHCQSEKTEKLEEQISVLQEDVEDVWSKIQS